MGYRSEWCLACKGPAEKIEAFVDELARRASQPSDGDYDAAEVAKLIFDSRLEGTAELAVWHDPDTKCYGEWDETIDQLVCFARQHGLKAAYCRLGEDVEDHDEDNDDGFYIPFVRRLDICRLGAEHGCTGLGEEEEAV